MESITEFFNRINKILFASPLYWGLLIICILIIFVCIKYGNNIIGWFGEHWTKQSLDILDKK